MEEEEEEGVVGEVDPLRCLLSIQTVRRLFRIYSVIRSTWVVVVRAAVEERAARAAEAAREEAPVR